MSIHQNVQVKSNQSGILALADGSVWFGQGHGATGLVVGEVCFNTAMTGYQEIITDPSYTGQFVVFTFPHIGNCGTNAEDVEQGRPESESLPRSGAEAVIVRELPTLASNWRSTQALTDWLASENRIALSGIDTRALTAHIRTHGMQNAAIYTTERTLSEEDISAAIAAAQNAPSMDGQDIAGAVTIQQTTVITGTETDSTAPEIAVIDFGIKQNIVSLLRANNLSVRIFPASVTAQEVLATKPKGVVFSNGPGDPIATFDAVSGMMRALVASGLPILGICLGHQLLALTLGGKTKKMVQGHHGANHPVQNLQTGAVEIVSMNHGFVVDEDSLPEDVDVSYKSLFDGTVSGLTVSGKPIISVQHHPEASPGPQEGQIVFAQFAELVRRYIDKA